MTLRTSYRPTSSTSSRTCTGTHADCAAPCCPLVCYVTTLMAIERPDVHGYKKCKSKFKLQESKLIVEVTILNCQYDATD